MRNIYSHIIYFQIFIHISLSIISKNHVYCQICLWMNMIICFVIGNLRGTLSSVNMLKGYMLRERLGTVALDQWFPTCGTRTTSGTQRSSRWYTSTFCLLLDRREFSVHVGLTLSFLEPSTLSRSVIPKLCAATDSQVFREAFWKKTV